MEPVTPVTRSAQHNQRRARWMDRLLVGALLGLALYTFEAGLAHIGLARDNACRAALASARVGPAAGSECLSELGLAIIDALAQGPAGMLFPEGATISAWAMSGAAYALLGGVCAQLAPGRAVLAYLGVQSGVLVVSSFVRFIGPHVIP